MSTCGDGRYDGHTKQAAEEITVHMNTTAVGFVSHIEV
jgi:hypothetical protein